MKKINSVLFIVIVFMVGCSLPDTFEGISWKTGFVIPLMDDSFTADDLESSENISIIDDQIFIAFDNEIDDSYTIDTQMNINSKTTDVLPLIRDQIMSASLPIDESGDIATEGDDIDIVEAKIANTSDVLQIEVFPEEDLQELILTFDNVFTENDEPLRLNITDFTETYQYDLANHILGSAENQAVLDSLSFTVETLSTQNTPSPLLGSFRVFFQGHLYLNFFRGYVYNKKLEVNDKVTDIEIDYPENLEDVFTLHQVALNFEIANSMGLETTFYAKLTAINENTRERRSIYIDEEDNLTFNAAISQDFPEITQRTLSDSVEILMNIFPTQFSITEAKFVVGTDIENYTLGFAGEGAGASGTVKAEIPFQFNIVSNEPIQPDTLIHVEVSEDNQEQIADNVEYAGLTLRLFNSYPVGGQIDLYFDTDEQNVYNEDTGFAILGNNVRAGALTAAETVEDTVTFMLDKDQLALFSNPDVYVGFHLRLDQTDADYVEIFPTDYIRILGRIEAEVNVDIESAEE